VIVQPVISGVMAKMWPLWQSRGVLIAVCLVVGGIVGCGLQMQWSKQAVSSDPFSKDGLPNHAGIIHILQTVPEIGIMLMLFISGVWFQEVPWTMFFGVLLIVVNHLMLGASLWPLHLFFPQFLPGDIQAPVDRRREAAISIATLCAGFGLLFIS